MNKNLLHEPQNLNDVLISLKKSLADNEKMGILTEVESVVEKIANTYQSQGHLHKALKHYRLLVEVKIEANRPPDELAKANHNVGEIYELFRDLKRTEALYLQSLELAIDPLLVAQCTVDLARVKFKLGSLRTNDLFISKFPSSKQPEFVALHHMLNAILAELEGFPSMAGNFYERAVRSESLAFNYREKCHQELVKFSLMKIMRSVTNVTVHTLKTRLAKWEEFLSNDFNLQASICNIYLLQAKLAQITNNYTEAKSIVKKCDNVANLTGLPLHQKLALYELNQIEHRAKIIANTPLENQANYNQQLFQEFYETLIDIAQLLDGQNKS